MRKKGNLLSHRHSHGIICAITWTVHTDAENGNAVQIHNNNNKLVANKRLRERERELQKCYDSNVCMLAAKALKM